MSEIRTAPVRARHVADKEAFFGQAVAGSFRVSAPGEDGGQNFWFFCPCGCGHKTWITVGNGFKPDSSPSWSWNGSVDAPTLSPSVHRVGHWHGWLRDGVWESC